jgi:hypothetical protein
MKNETGPGPSHWAVVLGLAPFAIACFSVAWWDRVHPLVLGLPFNFFWLLAGIVMTSLCLALTWRLERPEPPDDCNPP